MAMKKFVLFVLPFLAVSTGWAQGPTKEMIEKAGVISDALETALHSHLKDNPYITPTDICNFLLYHGNMKETAVLSTALGGYIFYSAETHTATFVQDMNDRKK